jgi:hypothetical protein
MALYPFLSRVFTRRVSATTGSSVAALMLLGLTLCVAGLLAFSCLNPPVWAREQGRAEQGEASPGAENVAEAPEGEENTSPPRALSEEAVKEVQTAAGAVATPDPQALAEALGVELYPQGGQADESATNSLESLGDLDGDGTPEMALRWTGLSRPAPEIGEEAEASQGREEGEPQGPVRVWIVFLLAWDGARWNVTRLMDTTCQFTVEVQPLLGPATRALVVVVSVGATAAPYPVIFQFMNHAATLLWDSRADESRYQGYAHGKVEFRDENGDGVFELVASGRADPGLLVFPPEGGRGFNARAVYVWDGRAYVPGQTKYSANEDYTLYRFISALHLRDFRSAYALVDPPKFLKTQEPSLEAFRKQIERTWPEFLGDHIFEAKERSQTAPDDFAFELTLADKLYAYQPSFSPDAKHLLTSLERREEK